MHLLSQNNFTHHFYCQCNLRISPFEGRNVPKSLKSLGTFPSLFAANGFPACAALLIINHPLPTANHLCFINILAGVRGAAMSTPCIFVFFSEGSLFFITKGDVRSKIFCRRLFHFSYPEFFKLMHLLFIAVVEKCFACLYKDAEKCCAFFVTVRVTL